MRLRFLSSNYNFLEGAFAPHQVRKEFSAGLQRAMRKRKLCEGLFIKLCCIARSPVEAKARGSSFVDKAAKTGRFQHLSEEADLVGPVGSDADDLRDAHSNQIGFLLSIASSEKHRTGTRTYWVRDRRTRNSHFSSSTAAKTLLLSRMLNPRSRADSALVPKTLCSAGAYIKLSCKTIVSDHSSK